MATSPETEAGFSLIELMVTIAIAAIVMGLAVPAFQETIRNNRTVAATNQFVSALALARSEAVNRNRQITLRRTSGTNDVWRDGWTMFVDLNGNGTLDDDGDANLCETNASGVPSEDCLLRNYTDGLPTGYTLTSTTNDTWIGFVGTGAGVGDHAGTDTFRLCDDSAKIDKSRVITINATGRSNIQTGGAASCP